MKLFRKSLLILFIGILTYSCGTESTPTYTVSTSVSPSEGGSIQLSPSGGTYDEGTQVTVTGNPSESWVFDEWNGTKSSTQNPFTFTVDQDVNLTGVFSKKTYPLNITVNGEGTVSEQVIQSKSTEYEHGTIVELTPTPSEGWKFVEWSSDVQSTESVIQVTVDSPVNVTVVFEKKSYPLNINVEGEGTVEEKVVQSKSTEYDFGTVVELTPIPSEGWEFVEWSGDIESEEEVIEVTINEETNITVTFVQPFFLHSNGVTIMCPNTKSGEKGFVDGVEYESVDRELLDQRRDEGFDLTKVCTSLITNMRDLFKDSTFNQPIGNWDVSNVSNMNQMFSESSFNQPIGFWDVSSVTIMFGMFHDTPFNQPIGNWDVSSVIRMNFMFTKSTFNQPIGNWDVSNVETMNWMFGSSVFNQPIGSWDVSNVEEINSMFRDTPFNQPIGEWDVSSVEEMISTFEFSEFNQPIGDWDVSNVRNMYSMFGRSMFNQPIGDWDVSNVRDMYHMFHETPFNQPIGNWDVSSVTNMDSMFSSGEFDQPIGNWDVSNVTNMDEMFFNTPFNQKINGWCVSNIPTEPERFSTYSPLTEENKPVWGTCPDN